MASRRPGDRTQAEVGRAEVVGCTGRHVERHLRPPESSIGCPEQYGGTPVVGDPDPLGSASDPDAQYCFTVRHERSASTGWGTSTGRGSGVHESPPLVVEATSLTLPCPEEHEKPPELDAAAFRPASLAARDSLGRWPERPGSKPLARWWWARMGMDAVSTDIAADWWFRC